MASSGPKSDSRTPQSAPGGQTNDAYRTKSIATRLTEAEFGLVESAAVSAGQKVSEWLRDAALSQARTGREEETDPILLAEILGLRALVLNLFAKASEGPLDRDDLRKISAYADALKQQKANELLGRRSGKSDETPEE